MEMSFREFKEEFQKNFEKATEGINHLFLVDVDGDEVWNKYLDSFPPGTNEILRERREFDCSACRHFIKQFGNVVYFKGDAVKTIWGFSVEDPKYQAVLTEMNQFILGNLIKDVYVSNERKIGVDKNYEMAKDGTKVTEWHHFYLEIPERFTNKEESPDTIKSRYRSTKDVFKRSLDEISKDAIETVLDLIYDKSLYKGEEWKEPLEIFLNYKEQYETTPLLKDDYAWKYSTEAPMSVAKIKNHSMGVLLTDITNEMDLDRAVQRYEKIVAPENYKRSKPIFTQKMLEKAKEKVEKLGYGKSLFRKFATLDDITANNILFSNQDAARRISGDVFAELEEEIGIDAKKFSRVEEVPIQNFVAEILPRAQAVEVFVENKHSQNMVSLIGPAHKDAPNMFKHNNLYTWGYAGNLTDSSMRENVAKAGGNVTGDLRFSIMWNDEEEWDQNDLDAHCKEPQGFVISYQNKHSHRTGGVLDVDIIRPKEGVPAVENITWSTRTKMVDGTYEFLVHQFSNRGGKRGFKAEIEFDGQIYEFVYNKELRQGEKIPVAKVTLKDGKFTIKEKITSSLSSKTIWNVKTQTFVPVSTVMYSPNYWDKQKGIGHRHIFFMLKGCQNPEKPNGFYNEFLSNELLEHRKVFEALGSKMRVKDAEDQLSGVGFSTTKRNEVIVKVIGQTERIMKVKI